MLLRVFRMLLRVFRLLFIIFVILVCIAKYFEIREDLNEADKAFLYETKNTHCVIRNIGSEKVTFRFNSKTSFFIYEDMEGKCRIGYYWQHLPLLEKKLNIPYVGSKFDKINPELIIENIESIQDALKKLNRLPKFPLSTCGKIKLIFEVLHTDYH